MKDKIILLVSLLIIFGILLFKYIDFQCKYARENKLTIKLKKIKNPIKITQITDFHSNSLKNLDYVLDKIKKFDADFIILTGDINDYGVKKKFDKAIYFLKKLSELGIRTYYISGNHEEAGPMFDEFIKEIQKLKIKYLSNSSDSIKVNGNELYIFGLTYYDFDYEKYKGGKDTVNIILSHYSKNVRDNLKGSEDIIFSGHTHGGQVRLPIIGAIYAPGEGFFPKYDKGLFDIKSKKLYIDSGLGNTLLNLRFLNRVQFSNITIKRQ